MSGSVSFNHINPSANRVPGINLEVNPNVANTGGNIGNVLLIGQGASSGSATANVPVLAVNLSNVQALCGNASMLTSMYQKYISYDSTATIYLLPVTATGATAGVQTITVTGPASGNGTLAGYFGGTSVPVAVTSGQTATEIAANIVTALGQTTLPVTATASAGVVTVTMNQAGTAAGDFPIIFNFYGASNNEALPAGVTVTVATSTAPAGAPALSTALANLGATAFDYIINPYTDETSTTAITETLSETSGRWSPYIKLFGQSFSAVRGTPSALLTFADTLNDPYQNVIGFEGAPESAYLWTVAYGATCAASLRVDPALTLTSIELNVIAPPVADAFEYSDRNALLFGGISTFNVFSGSVILERSRTTYEQNGLGIPDISYLDTETPATLTAVSRAFINQLGVQFARKKLVADGTPIPNGSNLTTAQGVLGACIGIHAELAAQGLVQNVAAFNANATAVNLGNGNVGLYLPVDIANQLRSININLSFSKS